MTQKGTSIGLLDAQLRGENVIQEQEYFPKKIDSDSNVDSGSEYFILKLVKKIGRGSVNIDGMCDVINPATGKVERARLLSGVDTIWLKDQKDLTKEYIDQNRRSLKFSDGVCRIPIYDTTAIEYAKVHNGFVDNPRRKTGSRHEFFQWDPKRMAEERLKKRMFKLEAMKKAMECPFEDMKKHATYLGVLPIDEMGIPKNEDFYRNEYILKAEENPERFMQSFGSKVVELSFLIRSAIMDAKIDFGKERNKAYFSTGKFICSIPSSRKPHEVLLELATSTTPEAKEFIDDLQRAVK